MGLKVSIEDEGEWDELMAESYVVVQAGEDFGVLIRTWLEEAPDDWDALRPEHLPQGAARGLVRIAVLWKPDGPSAGDDPS